MKLVVIKYNAGNTRSVLFALERLGLAAVVSDDPTVIRGADKVIFPGVGEASSAMTYLRARGLDEVIVSLEQPVLGICLGMQLLCARSEEGNTDCLGIFPQEIKKFAATASHEKIPQMGWNALRELKSPLFKGVSEGDAVYFVHGYYAEHGADTIAVTDYILPYSSALQKNNFYAVQFHPEKSGAVGERILKNFLEL